MLLGIGMSVTYTRALWEALRGQKSAFVRTPKFAATSHQDSAYMVTIDASAWVEMVLALYGLGTGLLALERAPILAPTLLIYAAGFAFTAVLALRESNHLRHPTRLNQPLKD